MSIQELYAVLWGAWWVSVAMRWTPASIPKAILIGAMAYITSPPTIPIP